MRARREADDFYLCGGVRSLRSGPQETVVPSLSTIWAPQALRALWVSKSRL